MNGLGTALDAGARATYGDGYDDLPLTAKQQVREHVLPLFNAMLPLLREAFASLVEERAESAQRQGLVKATRQLNFAAQDIREWSK